VSTIASVLTVYQVQRNVCIGGIAGPQLTQRLYTLNKLMRVAIGTNNVDFRTDYKSLGTKTDSAYSILASQPFKIADIDSSDVIVVFGSTSSKNTRMNTSACVKPQTFTHPRFTR